MIAKIEGMPIPRLNFRGQKFNFETWKTALEIALDMVEGMWDVIFNPIGELNAKQKLLDK